MKKLTLILLMVFVIIFAFSACGDEPVTVKVQYVAQAGGQIIGEATQSKELPKEGIVQFNAVTAQASEGYRFVGWSDGKLEATRADMLSADAAFTACFARIDYATITYQSSSDGGVILGQAVQKLEKGLFTTEVTAQANEGYVFVCWSDGNAEPSRTDVADVSKNIIAHFKKMNFSTITYQATEGGEVVGEKSQRLENGQTTTIVTATPAYGYHFVKWSDDVTDASRTDIANGDKTITAIFSNVLRVEYKVGYGGYIEGNKIQEIVFGLTSEEVTVYTYDGYTFAGWDDGTQSATRSDCPTESVTYMAILIRNYKIEFICDSNKGTLTGQTVQSIVAGEMTQAVTATAKEGFEFICWSNGETNPTIIINPLNDEKIEACFSYESSGLPVISIDTITGNDVTSKDTYIDCTITVYDTEGGCHVLFEDAQIRGRGNSTWEKFPKKPYKIKFNEKQELFDYGKAKDWVLLADYIDNSLIRNQLAYTVAGEFSSLESSPDCKSVEVYLNGEYHGVYLLCEQIEINKHRVEISEDLTAIDTGYLVEMDGWTDDVQVSVPDNLNQSRKYTVKAPDSDVITADQKAFIQKYLRECIAAIQGTDYTTVQELIDVESFAQAYIIFELFKNPDTNYSSLYFYKDAGGKLFCGPVWDFDMSIGNVSHKGNGVFKSTETLWTKDECPWFNALLKFDEFKKLVGEQLVEYAPIIRATLEECFIYAYSKQEAFEKNFEKWDVIGKNTWTNPSYIVAIKTWEGHIEYIKQYLEDSLTFLLEEYKLVEEPTQ